MSIQLNAASFASRSLGYQPRAVMLTRKKEQHFPRSYGQVTLTKEANLFQPIASTRRASPILSLSYEAFKAFVANSSVIKIQRVFRQYLQKKFSPMRLYKEYQRTHLSASLFAKKPLTCRTVENSQELAQIRSLLHQWNEDNERDLEEYQALLRRKSPQIRCVVINPEVNLFLDNGVIIASMRAFINNDRNFLDGNRVSFVKDENDTIQALCISSPLPDEGAWWINYLVTAPHNLRTALMSKYNEVRVEGAGSALIQKVIFDSFALSTKKHMSEPFLKTIKLHAITKDFYLKIGFIDDPVQDFLLEDGSMILSGSSLFRFLQSRGGRAI